MFNRNYNRLPPWYIDVRIVINNKKREIVPELIDEPEQIVKPEQIVETKQIDEPDDMRTTLADYIGYIPHTKEYALPNSLIRDINDAFYEENNDETDEGDEPDELGLTQKHIGFIEPIGDIDDGNFECELAEFSIHDTDIDYMELKSNKLGTGYHVSFLSWNDPSGESDDDGKTVYTTIFVLYS